METAEEILIKGQLVLKHLHRNVAVKPMAQSLIDDGHSTLAYFLDYLISVIKQLPDIFVLMIHLNISFRLTLPYLASKTTVTLSDAFLLKAISIIRPAAVSLLSP